MSVVKSQINEFAYENIVKTKNKVAQIRKTNKNTPQFIEEYGKYLLRHNYSPSTTGAHLTRTKQFCKQCVGLYNKDFESIDDFRVLTSENITKYESFIIGRVSHKEIKDESAYSCMKNFKLFLQFLRDQGIVNFKYSIPRKFLVRPTRSNVFISKELIIELFASILKGQTNFKYRNLAIILILVNTGCRLIEISNIKMNDINFTEKKLTLYSIKSGQRTLVLDNTIIAVLKKYVKLRKLLVPKSDKLFLKRDGTCVSSSYLSAEIKLLNFNAFGKSLINARSLRHTYITNAIENRNDLKEVSEAVGHKHWSSTLYYLHRSKKRLLINTLDFDPIKNLIEE